MSGFELRVFLLRDSRENRKKCTLTPLEGRAGIRFGALPAARPGRPPLVLPPGILLALDAPALAPGDRAHLEGGGGGELILLDATWARLPRMLARLDMPDAARLVRRSIPPGVVTAYPRVSKVRADPGAGLASVEALYAASVVLGVPREDWLDAYRWRDEFLARNRGFFARHAVPG